MYSVLSIDPSVRATGWCVLHPEATPIVGHCPLRNPADVSRLVAIVAPMVEQVDFRIAIESGFVGINSGVGLQLAQLRGQLLQAFFAALPEGVAPIMVAPSSWRKTTLKPAAKTKRAALKKLAMAFVQETFGILVSEDEAEALCLALHVQRQQLAPVYTNSAPSS